MHKFKYFTINKFCALALSVMLCFIFTTTAFSAPWVNLKLTYDFSVHNYNAEAVYININGKTLTNLSMPPIIMNNMTLVPAREVLEPLGAVVDWKKDTEEIYIAYEDTIAIVKIGSKTANCNGESVEMDLAPKIINNKTMVPVRFISENLGFMVNWVNSERTIYITGGEAITEVTTTPTTATPIQSEATTISEVTTETTTAVTTTEKTTTKDGEIEIENPFFKDKSLAQTGKVASTVTEISTEITTSATSNNEVEDNIYYDRNMENLALLSSCVSNGIDGIAQSSETKKHYFTFNLTAGSSMDSGSFDISDSLIGIVEVSNNNGKVTICFNENSTVDYKIYENSGYIYIKPYI